MTKKTTTRFIPIRQQIWQEPVFSPEEGEEFAPTRHQVDCWKAEASNFAATLNELPYGRRDWWDVLATRAYQAGRASVGTKSATGKSSETQPTDDELYEMWRGSESLASSSEFISIARAVLARWGRP